MKIFTILVAGTQAWTRGNLDPQPCEFNQWNLDNWWPTDERLSILHQTTGSNVLD